MTDQRRKSRRGVLALGGGLAALAAVWQWVGVTEPALRFENIPGAPGWQGAVTGGFSTLSGDALLFVGLDTATAPPPLPVQDLERVLYGSAPSETTPVAVFSDFFCPYCRGLTFRMQQRQIAGLRVHWHELPLLGPASVIAAQASVAADLQGGYAAFYRALTTAPFRASPGHMGQIADDIGLDGRRLVRDMTGPEVAQRLRNSRAAARRLGLFATPAMVIGRKAVVGEVPPALLDDLLKA